MAGDWIKVEAATLDKPEVARFAELLGVNRGTGILYLLRFWFWMDANASVSCPGVVRHVSAKCLDETMNCTGFSGALHAVGWLEIDEKECSIIVPNFDRHNGKPAKTRALDSKRKALTRLENVRELSEESPNKKGLEKRRSNTPIVPASVDPRFESFWLAYPRKASRAKAEVAFRRLNPDPTLLARMLQAIEVQKRSDQWTKNGGEFIPHASSWLNGQRWEDLMSVSQAKEPTRLAI